jgi:hypothetical protein
MIQPADFTPIKSLIARLEVKYEFDYKITNRMEVIDQIQLDTDHYQYLVKYTMTGDMYDMPGIFTHIHNQTLFDEIKASLHVINNDWSEELDKFHISVETKNYIKNGTQFMFSYQKDNDRSGDYPNPIEHITKNVTAELFNIIDDDKGVIDILIHSQYIPPWWKR